MLRNWSIAWVAALTILGCVLADDASAATPAGHHAAWSAGSQDQAPQPRIHPQVQPWYSYSPGFAAPAFQWGHFGVSHQHGFTTKHTGYYGRKHQFTIRRGY